MPIVSVLPDSTAGLFLYHLLIDWNSMTGIDMIQAGDSEAGSCEAQRVRLNGQLPTPTSLSLEHLLTILPASLP